MGVKFEPLLRNSIEKKSNVIVFGLCHHVTQCYIIVNMNGRKGIITGQERADIVSKLITDKKVSAILCCYIGP